MACSKMIYRPLGWLLQGCGIATSGTFTDKYFSTLALVLQGSLVSLHIFGPPISFLDPTYTSLFMMSGSIGLFGAFVFIGYNFCCRDAYLSIVMDLTRVDNELRLMGVQPVQSIKRQQTMFLVFLARCAVFTVTTQFYHPTVANAAYMLITDMITNSPILQHLVLVDLLHNQFSALNDRLVHIAAEWRLTSLQTVNSQLDDVFRVHTDLHVVVSDVNSHYFFYHLLGFTSRVLFFVFQMYGYLLSVSDARYSLDVEFFLSTLVNVIMMLTQCVVCHACAKEANRSVVLAHRVLQQDSPSRLWEEVGLFSELAVDNKVCFTVGGIFNIDRNLITKISVMSLSYLIIAVQLKDVELFGNIVTDNTTNSASNIRTSTV